MIKSNYDLDDYFLQDAENRANAHKKKPSDNLVMLNTRVPKDLRDRIKLAALKNDSSITDIVGEALENWLSDAEKQVQESSNAFEDDGILPRIYI